MLHSKLSYEQKENKASHNCYRRFIGFFPALHDYRNDFAGEHADSHDGQYLSSDCRAPERMDASGMVEEFRQHLLQYQDPHWTSILQN